MGVTSKSSIRTCPRVGASENGVALPTERVVVHAQIPPPTMGQNCGQDVTLLPYFCQSDATADSR